MISIIVPVYNIEKLIPRCIESILNSHNQDFEIFLIDDGSTDKSGEICDKYALIDDRIKCIHKINGGVSSARNEGLKHISGDWVVFVDGDDTIDKDFLTIPENSIKTQLIIKSHNVINNKDIISCKIEDKFLDKESEIFKYIVNYRCNALWDKIFSRSLISNRKFNENMPIGEDFLFFYDCIRDIRTINFCSKGYYNYYKYPSSAMGVFNRSKANTTDLTFKCINIIKDLSFNDKQLEKIFDSIIYSYCGQSLYGLKGLMNQHQFQISKDFFKKMSIFKLKYVKLKTLTKLLYYKYSFILKL